MSSALFVEIVLGLLPFITGFIAFRLSTRSAAVQAEAAIKAVDATAYDRATKITDGLINRLQAEVSDTRIKLDEARAELIKAAKRISVLETEVVRLREQLRRFRLGGNGPSAPAS